MTKQIIVFASGSGSNFQSLIDAVECGDVVANIRALVVDRLCSATQRAAQHNIDYFEVNRRNDRDYNVKVLTEICRDSDLIVCAGYLSILHADFIAQFSGKIINIHPSLLPKFGGQNMYGMNVHRAVIAAGEKQSGCSVHYVDSGIDTGEIIRQESVLVDKNDTAESLQKKVLVKEHQLLPNVVRELLASL